MKVTTLAETRIILICVNTNYCSMSRMMIFTPGRFYDWGKYTKISIQIDLLLL